MALKNGLKTLLLAESSITSLCPAQTIDSDSVDCVFIDTADQGVKTPYIVISRTGFDPEKTLGTTTGITRSEIDIDCFAETPADAESLAIAVATFFKDYTGAAGGSDTISAVLWEDMNDFENNEGNGNDQWRYAVTLTFTVFHS